MSEDRLSTAVALLAKFPEPGKVKTRFCPPCTDEQAARFAEAFLRDTAAMLSSRGVSEHVDTWWSCHGNNDASLGSILDAKFLIQRGSDLSERISNAVDDLFDADYERVVVLCADCPTVDSKYFMDSLAELDSNDVVFGPARDGGCVLVAMSKRVPELFSAVEMSTPRVLRDMMHIASRAGFAFSVMPLRYDLDTYDDLLGAIEVGELRDAANTLSTFDEMESLQQLV